MARPKRWTGRSQATGPDEAAQLTCGSRVVQAIVQEIVQAQDLMVQAQEPVESLAAVLDW
jgi:hypothetical protein